jgi:ABC-2 type transport system ATP-binding protein
MRSAPGRAGACRPPSVPAMEPPIEVRGLRKRYRGTVAVDGLTFTVRPGEVTGFVGPNGAGKSTTMRLILGLDSPDEGAALVNGRPYRSLRTPLTQLGALLDAGALHPGRRARDHLRLAAQVAGVAPGRVDEVLDEVGLTGAAHRRVRGYSLGMRQRLGLATALLGDPAVLVLDEPANGLDPAGMAWLRELLRRRAAAGGSVLISSHLLAEVAQTVDRVVIVHAGRLGFAGSTAELDTGDGLEAAFLRLTNAALTDQPA